MSIESVGAPVRAVSPFCGSAAIWPQQGRLPDKIMINTHPQRWADRPLPWIKELTTLTHTSVIISASITSRTH